MKKTLVLICGVAICANVWAAVKYVSKTGNDAVAYANNCASSPWLTIQYGLNTIVAGDTLIVGPGDYHEYNTIKINNTIVRGPAEPSMAHVNLNLKFDTLNHVFGGSDSIKNAVQHGFNLNGKNNVVIKWFEITNIGSLATSKAVFTFANDTNILISHNFIHEPNPSGTAKPASAIMYTNGTGFWNKNIIIRHNSIWRFTGSAIPIMGDGWIVDSNNISHGVGWNTLTGVKYSSGDEDGIRLAGSNHVIQDNWLHDVTVTEATGHIDAFQVFSVYTVTQWAKHITINHNFINNFNDCFMAEDQGEQSYCAANPAKCDSFGVKDTNFNYVYDITFSNNVIANQPAGSCWAIDIAIYCDHFTIKNNLFTNAGSIAPIVCCNATHVVYENNIIRSTSGFGASIYNLTPKTGSIWNYNAYVPDFTWPTKIQGYDGNSLFGKDLLFLDSSTVLGPDALPFTSDDGFQLTTLSPAIGAGYGGVNMGPYLNSVKPGVLPWQGTMSMFSQIRVTSNMAIEFYLPHSDQVAVQIFDLFGREIATLVHGDLGAGWHSLLWNTKNLAAGCYAVKVRLGPNIYVKKIPVDRK